MILPAVARLTALTIGDVLGCVSRGAVQSVPIVVVGVVVVCHFYVGGDFDDKSAGKRTEEFEFHIERMR